MQIPQIGFCVIRVIRGWFQMRRKAPRMTRLTRKPICVICVIRGYKTEVMYELCSNRFGGTNSRRQST
jgi:hypothetical protein